MYVCMVGAYCLLSCIHRLLETDTRREEGVVQLFQDLNVVKLSLDDIAEYR